MNIRDSPTWTQSKVNGQRMLVFHVVKTLGISYQACCRYPI